MTAEGQQQFLNTNLNKNQKMPKRTFVFLFILLIAADQFAKLFATRIFKNYNFAFSLPLPVWLMYGIYFLVLAAMVYYVAKHRASFSSGHWLAWVLIFAGALSNIFERIILGYVRDWIYIHNGIFNSADFFIILGIIILSVLNTKSKTQN